MQNRILEFDFLKGIMMILVVMFHLVIIDVTYPMLRAAVYTFHVPVFLLFSGYLAKTDKSVKEFTRTLYRLLVPYVVFETFYVMMLYFAGNAMQSTLIMDKLSFYTVGMRLVLYPMGAYWYLHTLILCYSIYFFVFHYIKVDVFPKLIIVGIVMYLLSYIIKDIGWFPITSGAGFVWESVLFFFIGILISKLGLPFMKIIPPSFWSLFPLVLLFLYTDNYYRGSLAGVTITLLTISFLMYSYNYIWNPIRECLCYVGRNSLTIFVFSPFFTSITKFFLPLFSFDSTYVVFGIVASAFIIVSCLSCAYFFDRFNFSKYLFCQRQVLI